MKNFRFTFFCVFCLTVQFSFADRVTNAYKQIQKGEFDKARGLLEKELEKSPESAGALHVLAIYFFTDQNTRYDLDSAYYFVQKALLFYSNTQPKVIESWQKEGISSNTAQQLKANIEEKAFSNAQKVNTVQSFQRFIDRFPSAQQLREATLKRNELAWQETLQQNTYEAYLYFLQNYPDAVQAKEAAQKRDKFVFERQTASGKLSAFQRFVKENPTNFYRENAIERIFQLSTVPHSIEIYTEFVKQFPNSPTSQRAWEWLLAFYQKDHGLQNFVNQYPDFQANAELQKLIQSEKKYLIPTFDGDVFTYLDEEGKTHFEQEYEEIPKQYRCKAISDDFVVVFKNNYYGLINKTGKEILPTRFDVIDFIATGLIRVTKNARQGLFQWSGRELLPIQFDAIEPLNKLFVKFKKDRRWGIATHNGITVLENNYMDIDKVSENFIRLRVGERYAIITNDELMEILTEKNKTISLDYEEVEILANDFVKIRQGKWQGLLNRNNQLILPPNQEQILAIGQNGWAVLRNNAWQIHSLEGNKISDVSFDKVLLASKFVAGKKEGKWGMVDLNGKIHQAFVYDSIAVIDQTFLLYQNKPKKITAEFTQGTSPISVDFTPFKNIRAEKGNYPKSETYLYYEYQGLKGLFDQKGAKILSPKYNNVYPIDPAHINVQLNGKYGLVNQESKLVLPIKYDGISQLEEEYMTLLINRKFGIYHPKKKILVEPSYDAQFQFFYPKPSQPLFIVSKSAKKGVIDAQNKIWIPFKYQDIVFWKDSTAWVLDDSDQWTLLDFSLKAQKEAELKKETTEKKPNKEEVIQATPKITFDEIQFINRQEESERFLLVKKDNLYGLWSSIKGELVAPQYNAIENKGTPEHPLFFAEKRQKNRYLLSYINAKGITIWTKVLSEEDYYRLICE